MRFIGLESYAKYNDNFRNILSVVDVSRKFYIWSPWRQRADLQSPQPKLPSRRPVWVRTDNFSIKTLRTCYATRAYSFRCVGTPTWNVRSWNLLNTRFMTDYTNILRIKIRSDISTFCRNLSELKMTRFTRRHEWRPRVWQIRTSSLYGREWTVDAFVWVKSNLV